MDHTYEWPLDWTPRDFKGNDVIGMANHLPEAYALITALGPTFIKRLTHALLARDGHFASLLLAMDTSPPYSFPLFGASPRATLHSASRAYLAPAKPIIPLSL